VFCFCRIAFYLAQTLMALARHAEAFDAYEMRIAMGGWHVRLPPAAWQKAQLLSGAMKPCCRT